MEERLDAMSLGRPDSRPKQPAKTDNMATLLTQALQSNDKKMLDVRATADVGRVTKMFVLKLVFFLQSVLNRGNIGIIRNTVKRLPLPVIVPLVKELSNRVSKHAQG